VSVFGRGALSASALTLVPLATACHNSKPITEHELVGYWVPLTQPPHGKAPDICATDATMSLKAGGGYEDLFDRGRWRLADGKLTVTITHSSEDSSGEAPERMLPRPRHMQFVIKHADEQVLETELASAKVWLFRCKSD